MKHLILLSVIAMSLSACGKSSSSTSPILQAADGAVCAVESAVGNGLAISIQSQCGAPASQLAACSAAIVATLGNADLCDTSLPSSASVVKALAVGVKWQKVGDITAAQLAALAAANPGGAVGSKIAKPADIVGSVVCPLADAAVVGLLTAAVPVACGCTTNLQATTINSLLVEACEAVL